MRWELRGWRLDRVRVRLRVTWGTSGWIGSGGDCES